MNPITFRSDSRETVHRIAEDSVHNALRTWSDQLPALCAAAGSVFHNALSLLDRDGLAELARRLRVDLEEAFPPPLTRRSRAIHLPARRVARPQAFSSRRRP